MYNLEIEIELNEEQYEWLDKHGGDVLIHCCLPQNGERMCEDIQRLLVMEINRLLGKNDIL